MITLPKDTYYRGYRLTLLNEGKKTETVAIHYGTDHLGFVPTIAQARETVDGYVEGWVR